MELLPPHELSRRVKALQRTRVNELVALGIARVDARRQVMKEFSVYDRILMDERGWICFEGLTLPYRTRTPGKTVTKSPRRRRRR
jgi:hypothetical protein